MFSIVNNKNDAKILQKRRKLRNENLELILKSSEVLLEDFVELDTKNKSKLPTSLNSNNDAILRINAYIVEILTRDTEEMIVAFPLHNIANVCYAKKNNNSHVIAIQHGDTFESNEYYNIYILYVNNKSEAETICNLFKQCFQLLHIERTMSLLDQVIRDETVSNCSMNTNTYNPNEHYTNYEITPNINRKNDSNNMDDVRSVACSTIHDQVQQQELNKTTEPVTTTVKIGAHQTIESFINKLKKELNKAEFESFAKALAEWQKGKPFEEFCKEALRICGPERKHLIIDMKVFVPMKHLEWYENFVKDEIKRPSRSESVSSNESSSSLVADNAKNLDRSTRTLYNISDQSFN